MVPERLYVVIGTPRSPVKPPGYSTNPRDYGLNVFNRDVSDEEFDREFRHRTHAYRTAAEAVDAMYDCGLLPSGSFLLVFKRDGAAWVRDDAEADRVIEETPW